MGKPFAPSGVGCILRAMRSLPRFFPLVFLAPGWLAANDLPAVKAPLPDLNVAKNSAIAPIVLPNHFEVTGIAPGANRVVQFNTGAGIFNVELATPTTPTTVANFLSYVNAANASNYNNTFIHRSDKPLRIIQGGGYKADASFTELVTSSPIALDVGNSLPNSRGTISMARLTAPDTATCEWFINTGDNSLTLPPASSGGYAVFGRVTGTGMNVVDAIAGLPVLNGTATVTSSSTSSPTVTVSSVPSTFATGWALLGRRVQSIAGNVITLNGNANQTISAPTAVGTSWDFQPFNQLPFTGALAAGNTLTVNNVLKVNSVSPATIFATTLGVQVTTSSTANATVTTTGIPVGLAVGSKFMGTTIASIVGNFIFLNANADRTIGVNTLVPATLPDERNVVTFSVENTNPGLVRTSVVGSALDMQLRSNRGGVATLTARATDSNGNSAQSSFRVNVTGGSTAPSDVNSDGLDDLIIQSSTGQVAGWYLNGGSSVTGWSWIFNGAIGDWRVAAVMDVNSDGREDIILQNAIGQVVAWFMNPTGALSGSLWIYGVSTGGWQIVCNYDVNHDGRQELLLQNSTGQMIAWSLDAAGSVTGWSWLYQPALGDWRAVTGFDVNGDGREELLLQNTSGQVYSWTVNTAGAVTSGSFIYSLGLGDWKVVATIDVNGDDRRELVLQNNFGQVYGWYVNSAGVVTGGTWIYNASTGGWRVR